MYSFTHRILGTCSFSLPKTVTLTVFYFTNKCNYAFIQFSLYIRAEELITKFNSILQFWMINRSLNKSLCLHNMFVCIFINTYKYAQCTLLFWMRLINLTALLFIVRDLAVSKLTGFYCNILPFFTIKITIILYCVQVCESNYLTPAIYADAARKKSSSAVKFRSTVFCLPYLPVCFPLISMT